MKKIIVTLEFEDNGNPLTQTEKFIKDDLIREINCCSNFYEVLSIDIKEE